jgi:hypothetical protein
LYRVMYDQLTVLDFIFITLCYIIMLISAIKLCVSLLRTFFFLYLWFLNIKYFVDLAIEDTDVEYHTWASYVNLFCNLLLKFTSSHGILLCSLWCKSYFYFSPPPFFKPFFHVLEWLVSETKRKILMKPKENVLYLARLTYYFKVMLCNSVYVSYAREERER